ncbi:MAG: hypothetical protein ACM31J_06720 [Nitrososphaerales archaeon]
MNQDFWHNIFRYKEYGFEPLNWIANFSNEMDQDVFENSINRIKGTNAKFTPDWIDYFIKCEGKVPELTRRFYDFTDSEVSQSETGIKKALTIICMNSDISEDAEKRFSLLNNFISGFKSKFNTKKVTVLSTSSKKQFALLDFIETRRGNKIGYILANNYVTQVTDVTDIPESEIHTQITVSGAIENLNLLGCTSEFRIFPIYDGPTEEILDITRKNFDLFTLSNNIYMEDYPSLKIGNLFFGATSTATTLKELPLRYEDTEEGMNLIITDKFGSIIPLNLFLLTQINEENISLFEKNGVSYETLKHTKDMIFKNLVHPRFELGKIINKYCPDFGEKYDKSQHITAVFPILTKGLLAIKLLSRYTDSEITIQKIPVKYHDIACYAVKEYFLQNPTSSVNGCHAIIASRELTDSIIQDLKKINLEPEVIGSIGRKGKAFLDIRDINFDKYFLPRSKMYKKLRSFRPKQPNKNMMETKRN